MDVEKYIWYMYGIWNATNTNTNPPFIAIKVFNFSSKIEEISPLPFFIHLFVLRATKPGRKIEKQPRKTSSVAPPFFSSFFHTKTKEPVKTGAPAAFPAA